MKKRPMIIYGKNAQTLSVGDIKRLDESFGLKIVLQRFRPITHSGRERIESVESAVGKFNALIPMNEWSERGDKPSVIGEYIASVAYASSGRFRRWWNGSAWSNAWLDDRQDQHYINKVAATLSSPAISCVVRFRGLAEEPIYLDKK